MTTTGPDTIAFLGAVSLLGDLLEEDLAHICREAEQIRLGPGEQRL